MRTVIGYGVLSVGLVLGLTKYNPGHDDTSGLSSSFQVISSAQALTDASYAIEPRLAGFSPGRVFLASALKSDQQEQRSSVLDVISSRIAVMQVDWAGSGEAGKERHDSMRDVALAPWRSAVITEPSGFGPNGTQVAAEFIETAKKAEIAAEIQTELKRVGCYSGEIDGRWGGQSRRALETFLDRVNAALPIAEPEVTLLELVKAHPAETCGQDCPSGQDLSDEGRCVPRAVLAQDSRRKLTRPTALAQQRRPPLPGRMSVGAAVSPIPARLPTRQSVETASQASPVTARTRIALADDGLSSESGERPVSAPAPKQSPAQVKPRSRSSESRSAPQRSSRLSGYRAVQHLFENPLGRL